MSQTTDPAAARRAALLQRMTRTGLYLVTDDRLDTDDKTRLEHILARSPELADATELVRAAIRFKRHREVQFDTLGVRVARTMRP